MSTLAHPPLAMQIRQFVATCLALIVAWPLVAPAATVAERSPFAQGLWAVPDRSGDGFEIWSTADQVGVLWFTYDEGGRPTWYLASGPLASLGTQAWPLMQFRWSNGAVSAPSVAGSLRLDVKHAEAIDATWEIGARRGTWTLQPMLFSGVINETDHGNVWFDPRNSGWGMSLTEHGEVLAGVVYAYDASGAPTWALGANGGRGRTLAFHAYNGACPGCAYRAPAASPTGSLALEMVSETSLVLRGSLGIATAPGVAVDGAQVVPLGRPASWRAADRQLASFADAASLRAYLTAGMLNLPPASTGGSFSAPPPSTAFSPTNLQETGVDEADVVKTDGRYLYTFAYADNGARRPQIRVARVDNDGSALVPGATVALGSGAGTPMGQAGLFLHDGALVAIGSTQPTAYGTAPWAHAGAWLRGSTFVEIFDTARPESPAARWRAEIDGHLVASRRIGSRVYVVSRHVPFVPGFEYGTTFAPSIAANQQLLAAVPLADLLPKVRINGGAPLPAVEPAAVHVPPQGSRKPLADIILVTAIDLAAARIAQTLAIVGTVETAYASPANLYVASTRHDTRNAISLLPTAEPPNVRTDVHQIVLAGDAMRLVGSGTLEGVLGYDVDKAAFRLSEHRGQLRAVTSAMSMWGDTNRNRLTILEPSTLAPGLLKTLSYLPNARRPQPLGKPHELLYGTRFLGERLYAVTFKKIDPLYVVDLADAADPRIAGELELPGFSDYLHPLPNGLLLGFGKDARPAQVIGDGTFAWFQGLQLTLFDVRDASQPREIQRVLMGKRGSHSALLQSHHAFSALARPDGTWWIALPASIHDGAAPPGAADSYTYPWNYSGLMRFELRGTSPTDARLVQQPTLVTHRAQTPLFAPAYNDAAAKDARSILFPGGAVYVGNGQFWHQDSTGVTTGPR